MNRPPAARPALFDSETLKRLCRSRDLLAADPSARLPLAAAARAACLSPWHFQRLFTRAFGESPHRFVARRRIELAKRLLAADRLSVTEVCFEAGYASLGSFSAKFSAWVGCPPSAYRREVRRVFGYRALWRIAFVPACFLGRFGIASPWIAGSEGSQEARSAARPGSDSLRRNDRGDTP